MKIKLQNDKYWQKLKIIKLLKEEIATARVGSKVEPGLSHWLEAYNALLKTLKSVQCEEVFEVVKFEDFAPPKPKLKRKS